MAIIYDLKAHFFGMIESLSESERMETFDFLRNLLILDSSEVLREYEEQNKIEDKIEKVRPKTKPRTNSRK